jgi:hypothetical protein
MNPSTQLLAVASLLAVLSLVGAQMTSLQSVNSLGSTGNDDSDCIRRRGSMSADGNLVVLHSNATNLVPKNTTELVVRSKKDEH